MIVLSIALVIIGIMLPIFLVNAIVRGSKARREPVLSVRARVVSKRTDANSLATTYFVTFEGEGGERQEFLLTGNEFGLLVEGDAGMLSRQGARFAGFQRQSVAVRR